MPHQAINKYAQHKYRLWFFLFYTMSLSDDKLDIEKASDPGEAPLYVAEEEVRPEEVIVSRYGRFGSLFHRLFSMGVEARGVCLSRFTVFTDVSLNLLDFAG